MQCHIDPSWLRDFDAAMKRHFLMDHAEAGMGQVELARYADLRPYEAALQYGEDYDLQRVDVDWMSPAQRPLVAHDRPIHSVKLLSPSKSPDR